MLNLSPLICIFLCLTNIYLHMRVCLPANVCAAYVFAHTNEYLPNCVCVCVCVCVCGGYVLVCVYVCLRFDMMTVCVCVCHGVSYCIVVCVCVLVCVLIW